MFRLDNKSVLITGASGHIGSEVAYGLAMCGAHVYINSRNFSKCENIVSKIKEDGGLASVACFDITNIDEVKNFSTSIDCLDILVNNASGARLGTVETAEPADYMSCYNVNVISSANLVKTLLPHFRRSVLKNGYASIINIASMYGMVSPDKRIYNSPQDTNPPHYGSAKAALIQWTKYAACEFAKENIRVNSISPGPFPSALVQKNNPQLVEKIISKVPMNRIGAPNELVGSVVFFASSASSYVTGINLPVDGGWTAW